MSRSSNRLPRRLAKRHQKQSLAAARRKRRCRADITMSDGFMTPEAQLHEVWAKRVAEDPAFQHHPPGSRGFPKLAGRHYVRVLREPQVELDGLSGNDWLAREAPPGSPGGYVVTRLDPNTTRMLVRAG